NVYEGPLWSGLALDVSARQHDAQQRLSDVVDVLRQKFGRGVVLRGHDFVLRARDARAEEQPAKTGGTEHGVVEVKVISGAGAEREQVPRGNNRRRGIVVERTGGPYPTHGSALLIPTPGTPPLKEPPVPYPLAVVERQRLGKYAARQPPATKTRPFS